MHGTCIKAKFLYHVRGFFFIKCVVRRLTKKFYNTFFVLLVILFVYMSLNVLLWYAGGCITRPTSFYVISVKYNSIICSLHLTNFEFCSRSHFASNHFITSKLFSPSRFPWALQRSEHLMQQDLGRVVGGEEQSIRVLWLLPVFFKIVCVFFKFVCVFQNCLCFQNCMLFKIVCFLKLCFCPLSCSGRISSKFLWGSALLKRFCGVLKFDCTDLS